MVGPFSSRIISNVAFQPKKIESTLGKLPKPLCSVFSSFSSFSFLIFFFFFFFLSFFDRSLRLDHAGNHENDPFSRAIILPLRQIRRNAFLVIATIGATTTSASTIVAIGTLPRTNRRGNAGSNARTTNHDTSFVNGKRIRFSRRWWWWWWWGWW